MEVKFSTEAARFRKIFIYRWPCLFMAILIACVALCLSTFIILCTKLNVTVPHLTLVISE